MKPPNTRVLVVGGSGFIGCSFANWATTRGYEVGVCSRSMPVGRKFAEGIQHFRADATDLASLQGVFAQARPQVVLFAVTQIQPRSETSAPHGNILSEIRALLNTLECISQTECSKLVYLSSAGAIYGGGSRPSQETDPCMPRSIYGKMKLQIEQIISVLASRSGANYAILRVSNPFGPGQSPYGSQGVIPIFIRQILSGEPIHIFGGDQSSKDYVFIDDLNRAIEKSIEVCDNRVYNIGSGHATRLRTLIQMIEQACGQDAQEVHNPLSAQEVESFSVDVSRAEQRLQWKASTPMQDGILQLRRWLEEVLAVPEVPTRK